MNKAKIETDNESNSLLSDDSEETQSYISSSILTRITPSIGNSNESINNSICLERYDESDSGASVDKAYYFKLKIHINPKIEDYMNIIENDELFGWPKYCFECHKYSLPPIKSIEDCFNGNPILNLSNYNPKSIGIQLACAAVCGPPIVPLTHIDFSSSTFTHNGCYTLANFIEASTTLKYLNLRNCRIGTAGAEILVNSLETSKSLIDINLSKCDLNDSGGAVIIKAMALNECCQNLNLGHNLLYTKCGIELGKMLRINNVIEYLTLEWNNLFPEMDCIVRLLNGLQKNKSLKQLNLSWNGLNGEEFTTKLKTALKNHKNLEILDLQNNRIAGPCVEALANGLRDSKSLKSVYLGGNPLTENDINMILEIFFKIPTLKFISFGDDMWLTKNTIALINKIKLWVPTLIVIYKGTLMSNPPEDVDFAPILINRCKFLAMKPKNVKFKKNMGHFFQKIIKDDIEFCTKEEFIEMIKVFKAKLDDNLINQIAENWIIEYGTKRTKIRRIKIKELATYYLKRHPTEPKPPTPPPPPPPPPAAVKLPRSRSARRTKP